MQKKAQSALEYLLTYGWAILIVIIVGASLYALGVFNPGTFTGKRVTGFTQFQIIDHKVDTDAELVLNFGNRLGKTVTLGDIDAEYKGKTCSSSDLNGEVMGANSQKNITMECDITGESNNWTVTGLDLRSSYSIIIDIGFTDPDSELDHIDSGTLFGAVESN